MGQIYERIKQDIQQDTYYSQNFANDGERFLAWYLRKEEWGGKSLHCILLFHDSNKMYNVKTCPPEDFVRAQQAPHRTEG